MSRYSIILPVRNGGQYLRDCVNSILAQQITDFNLVILDNCSTDDSLTWIDSLKDDRIVVLTSLKPLTIEENWGRILSIPKNEFMTMIGHDDLLNSSYLAVMDRLINEHPEASLYQTHFQYIDSKSQMIRPCLPMDEKQQAHEFFSCQMNRIMDSTGTGYMMRSKVFDSLGGMPVYFPNLIFSDYCLWIKIMLTGYKATALEQCFSYRIHKSVSATTDGTKYQKAFIEYMDFLHQVIRENILFKEVFDRYGMKMLSYFCESLSHRLLKSPSKDRQIKVSDFIRECERIAQQMLPGQEFKPMRNFRIRVARQLDETIIGRSMFSVFKKLSH